MPLGRISCALARGEGGEQQLERHLLAVDGHRHREVEPVACPRSSVRRRSRRPAPRRPRGTRPARRRPRPTRSGDLAGAAAAPRSRNRTTAMPWSARTRGADVRAGARGRRRRRPPTRVSQSSAIAFSAGSDLLEDPGLGVEIASPRRPVRRPERLQPRRAAEGVPPLPQQLDFVARAGASRSAGGRAGRARGSRPSRRRCAPGPGPAAPGGSARRTGRPGASGMRSSGCRTNVRTAPDTGVERRARRSSPAAGLVRGTPPRDAVGAVLTRGTARSRTAIDSPRSPAAGAGSTTASPGRGRRSARRGRAPAPPARGARRPDERDPERDGFPQEIPDVRAGEAVERDRGAGAA